ncbi:restriction endonuclease subunit S [Erythrobacter sp. LQ02-29]|uniref:restriction endonuclease subunit S n=1 Tax=Erythrobacter sp. LQ02-29 TaxID=2920384 RepID=UPI001F4D7A4F|nr:restriction endonuclease subunit S [Erythrobacter sp. LQ02-29]MCP9223136.1 restriction endonuclease subunit S [Erythrobacter sp. LQ02-29]
MKEVTLNDVATVTGGHAFKSSQYTREGRFVLRTVNIRDDYSITKEGANFISETDARNYERFTLEPLDTLFVMVAATLGKIGLVREADLPALLNQNMWVIRARPGKIDKRYLHYLFREISKIPLSWVGGSARSFLRRDDVRNLQFLLPPLTEQEKIAAILAALDDKIELNRRMNETLEAQARALFRDWFVNFGPVKAKMAGDTPYLAPDLWSLFPNRLDNEGVPQGWKLGSLNLVSTLNPESWTAKNAPEKIEYVDLANTKWGYIETAVGYEWEKAPSRARRVLRPGDTIVGTVRPGNGSFSYIAKSGLTGSTGFAVLRPKNEHDRTLSWCAATDPENIARLSHLADGGAYPAVRPDAVVASPLVVPPKADLLQYFEKTAGILLDRIESNKAESETLGQTRDLLLPKLMSGEIRIDNVASEELSAA